MIMLLGFFDWLGVKVSWFKLGELGGVVDGLDLYVVEG